MGAIFYVVLRWRAIESGIWNEEVESPVSIHQRRGSGVDRNLRKTTHHEQGGRRAAGEADSTVTGGHRVQIIC